MPDEKTNKQTAAANGGKEPSTAPEVPDDTKFEIVDSTAPSSENETPESDKDTPSPTEVDTATPNEGLDQDLGDEEQIMPDSEPPKPAGKFKRFVSGYWHHKKWTLPLTLLVIVAVVFAVPTTRYKILGMWLQRSYGVTIVDSKTNTPVSGAKVTLDGQTATTGSDGTAKITAKVGKRTLTVSKQYYKDSSQEVFVGIREQRSSARLGLDATGRQVPITVVNKITNKPIRDAEIKVLDTEAKTDAHGKAIIVLPTTEATQPVVVTATGYNKLAAKVQVTDKSVPANTFAVVPGGRVYFLSNLSGNIDVVSSNLDGTSRKTIVDGTGSEDPNNTVLLASRDWKYLALLSKRDGEPKLYLINTATGQRSVMDEGNDVSFRPVGWSGHYFVYTTIQTNPQPWTANYQKLKSFNAEKSQLLTLDHTSGDGTKGDYASQLFTENLYIAGDSIVYSKEWNSSYSSAKTLAGKKNQILSIYADSSHRRTLKEIPLSASVRYTSFSSSAYRPQDIYFAMTSDNGEVSYEYKNGYVTQSNTLSREAAQQTYPTYLLSPSGNQTFWSESRDGKNTLLVGDSNGASGKQIATLSDYQPYGWLSEDYVLVSKGRSELYVMPAGGGKALKVADYFSVLRPYNRYVYGYGGL